MDSRLRNGHLDWWFIVGVALMTAEEKLRKLYECNDGYEFVGGEEDEDDGWVRAPNRVFIKAGDIDLIANLVVERLRDGNIRTTDNTKV